jgi:hypothetical protein
VNNETYPFSLKNCLQYNAQKLPSIQCIGESGANSTETIWAGILSPEQVLLTKFSLSTDEDDIILKFSLFVNVLDNI